MVRHFFLVPFRVRTRSCLAHRTRGGPRIGLPIIVHLHPGTKGLIPAHPGGLTTDGQLDMMMILPLGIKTETEMDDEIGRRMG